MLAVYILLIEAIFGNISNVVLELLLMVTEVKDMYISYFEIVYRDGTL